MTLKALASPSALCHATALLAASLALPFLTRVLWALTLQWAAEWVFRALQNTFNPAVLLLISSKTPPVTCLELGWGEIGALSWRCEVNIPRGQRSPCPVGWGAGHPRSGTGASLLGGTFTCRIGVFLPSFSLFLLVSATEPPTKGYFLLKGNSK